MACKINLAGLPFAVMQYQVIRYIYGVSVPRKRPVQRHQVIGYFKSTPKPVVTKLLEDLVASGAVNDTNGSLQLANTGIVDRMKI